MDLMEQVNLLTTTAKLDASEARVRLLDTKLSLLEKIFALSDEVKKIDEAVTILSKVINVEPLKAHIKNYLMLENEYKNDQEIKAELIREMSKIRYGSAKLVRLTGGTFSHISSKVRLKNKNTDNMEDLTESEYSEHLD